MIFLILYFFLFSVSVFAAPTINITNFPDTVIVGQTFPLTFLVENAAVGTTYHYKSVGDTTTDISIFPSCASKYDDCLNLIIGENSSALATATAQINTPSNSNNLKIRIAQADKHSTTFDSPFVTITSFLAPSTPTPLITPTAIPSLVPEENSLIITEIMANPETDQNEWIEIFNSGSNTTSLKNLCFYDASKHSRCIPDEIFLNPDSYYSHQFSSGFLNNDGDSVTFSNKSVIYPKSPKNLSYSLQSNNSWCFTESSQNSPNHDCVSVSSSSGDDPSSPLINLQFSPDSLRPGDDFTLLFSLKSSDSYSLRLISPFGSQYFPFADFKDGYSWLNLPLSIPKKLPPGSYPLSFHLKKAGSSHLFDIQSGTLNILPPSPISSPKVLGLSRNYSSSPLITPTPLFRHQSDFSTLNSVLPDTSFFSWPFLFLGSILFLSPILFPKLYSA